MLWARKIDDLCSWKVVSGNTRMRNHRRSACGERAEDESRVPYVEKQYRNVLGALGPKPACLAQRYKGIKKEYAQKYQ
jgi:hypothetical protein